MLGLLSRESANLIRDIDSYMKEFWLGNWGPTYTEWVPDTYVKESKDKYTILMDVPGINPEDIETTIENQKLIIKGERKNSDVVSFSRKFKRIFSLPSNLDTEKITASYENGVLAVQIPRKVEAQPRKIEIEMKDPKKLTE